MAGNLLDKDSARRIAGERANRASKLRQKARKAKGKEKERLLEQVRILEMDAKRATEIGIEALSP